MTKVLHEKCEVGGPICKHLCPVVWSECYLGSELSVPKLQGKEWETPRSKDGKQETEGAQSDYKEQSQCPGLSYDPEAPIHPAPNLDLVPTQTELLGCLAGEGMGKPKL